MILNKTKSSVKVRIGESRSNVMRDISEIHVFKHLNFPDTHVRHQTMFSRWLIIGLILPATVFFCFWLSLLLGDYGPRHPYIGIASGAMFVTGIAALFPVPVAITRLISNSYVRTPRNYLFTGLGMAPLLFFLLFYFGIIFSDGA